MQETLKNKEYKRIDELEKILKYHAKKYYEENTNEISDYEYDKLNSELKNLYKKYPEKLTKESITQKVGGKVLEGFEKVNHKVPMQSLQDVFNFDEVKEFYDKIEKEAKVNHIEDVKFVVETKIDGLSASLKYVDGKFVQGATRGDGIVGEDVTLNLGTIDKIPKQISHKGDLTLRGEVFIGKEDFEQLNKKRQEESEAIFANARNAAAGSLRQLDSSIARKRPLDIFIFNVQEDPSNLFNSHYAYLDFLEQQGFKVINLRFLCSTYDEIIEAIKQIGEKRAELPYGIDGAVIKVDNLRFRKILGVNAKTPKWAIAYKYPPEEKETVVEDIIFTVGRTGTITPTAILKPVRVDGSVISKVTLHNEDILKQKDVRIGDSVLIHKAGDVIPELEKVLIDKRDGTEKEVQMPNKCPVCGAPAYREPGQSATKCTGVECPAKLHRTLEHFVSRNAMNIDGLGENIVQTLLDEKLISNIADIYDLTIEDLKSLKKEGTKFATNLINAIEKSKENNLDKLINALGIPHVGTKVSQILAKKFKTIDNLENAKLEDIQNVSDIGPIMAKEIYDFFKNPQTKDLIKRLKEKNVNMTYIDNSNTTDKLKDLIFVITGTFEKLKRGEISNMIEENGGKVSGSVSKKTSYLIAGEDAGSKLEKAKKLDVPIIGLEQLEDMINK